MLEEPKSDDFYYALKEVALLVGADRNKPSPIPAAAVDDFSIAVY